MNDDQNLNPGGAFLDHETFRANENEEIVDPRVFFALSNDLLVIAGADGYFHRMNQTWEKTTGYSIEELRSRPFLDFVHPEDREKTLETARRNFAGFEITSFENRYICKDGSIKWLLWNSVPSKQANLTYAVAHDITDRKKAEAELLELSLALANALEGIAQIDTEGEFISTNKSFANQLGYAEDDLIGVHWQNIVVPSSLDKLRAAYERLKESGKANFDAQGLRKDGTTFHAEVTIVKIADEKQQFIGHHCFMKDITERKEAELHLERSEARFRNLSAQLPGVVYQFVVNSDGSRHFPYISDSCKTITGYDPLEVQKDPGLSFRMIHAQDLPGLKAQIMESIRLKAGYSFEGRIVTKQGETKWIQARCSPEALGSDDLLWNCILMDITELKKAEEKIKQLNDDLARRVSRLSDVNHELGLLTRKLELAYDQALEASKLKSEFVANISHEVRTPLSAVIGMADLLLDTQLSEEQHEFARIVKDSAKSLLTIINDILDFSKMEAGKMELEVVEFDLLALVEGCVELLASSAREKGLHLITFLDPMIPRVMQGDPVRLRQVILNLTSNAIKFTDEGKVVVKVEPLSRKENEMQLRFSVKDTGVGLSQEAKSFLFQPFVQADGSTTRKYGGTGLGLSISKRLVELMDGMIGVESEFGRGANFSFTVSLGCAPDSTTILQDLAKPEIQGKRVLIVDENDSLSHGVQPYLEAAGLTTTVVSDPRKAVFQLKSALLQAMSYHLLIVDFDKKYSDSNRQFIETIAESARDSHTPVIYLINFDEKERVVKAVKNTYAASFLSKPVRQLALYQQVAEMLSNSAFSPDDWDEASATHRFVESTISLKTAVQTKGSSLGIINVPPADDLAAKVIPPPAAGSVKPAATAASVSPQLSFQPPGQSMSTQAAPVAAILSPGTSMTQLTVKPGGKSKYERTAKRKILLAEDNIIMQKLAIQQLSKLGFAVTTVSNGKEVLEELEKNDYAMILMDCQMPVIDGFETTKIIRNQEKTSGKRIPVVALTASAMLGDEEICYAAGMDDYLCKPVDRQKLTAIVNKWCPPTEDFERTDKQAETTPEAGHLVETALAVHEQMAGENKGEKENFAVPDKDDTDKNDKIQSGEKARADHENKASQPLDIEKIFDLDQLIALYGKESIPELLLSFIEEGATILQMTRKALDEKDVQELRMQAHTFKGMAAVLTAAQLAQISLNLEQSAKTASLDEAERGYTALQEGFNQARNSIQNILEKSEKLK